jgi:hypothetical protein
VLPIEEHTTDTHGYTETISGAYDLLGLRFAPRIRDLDRQRLYRHGTPPNVETGELLKHKLRPKLITPYWDELLRLAASLRHGWAPASLLLARLQAGSRRNPLAHALQEYGRLVKTNFVLDWLADQELRARVGRQLNKGEQLHSLRRAIFYANEGRRRADHQQRDRAHLAARAPAHPSLRPVPLRPRQPTYRLPATQNADGSHSASANDAEPRLTLSVKIRTVTNFGSHDGFSVGAGPGLCRDPRASARGSRLLERPQRRVRARSGGGHRICGERPATFDAMRKQRPVEPSY